MALALGGALLRRIPDQQGRGLGAELRVSPPTPAPTTPGRVTSKRPPADKRQAQYPRGAASAGIRRPCVSCAIAASACPGRWAHLPMDRRRACE